MGTDMLKALCTRIISIGWRILDNILSPLLENERKFRADPRRMPLEKLDIASNIGFP